MYNEPNILPFWRPKPNVDDYIQLARATGRAIREAAPGETFIGPAVSGMDFRCLEACLRAGLLEYWSAVSVHPFRQSDPETALCPWGEG
jgi:polysaccharide biosynthesis protein PslG